MRVLGFLIVVSALILGGVGISQQRENAEQRELVGSLEVVDAQGLRAAKDGALVLVEGRVASQDEVAAPISGAKVAWWGHQRRQIASSATQDCQTIEGETICSDRTQVEVEELPAEVSGDLEVSIAGSEGALTVAVPAKADAFRGLRLRDEQREKAEYRADASIDVREYTLDRGDRVTIAGARGGERSVPTITAASGLPVLFGGSAEDAQRSLEADVRAGRSLLNSGVALLVIGIALFVAGQARARSRRREEALRRAAQTAAADDAAAVGERDHDATDPQLPRAAGE